MTQIRPRSSLPFVSHTEFKRETAGLWANVHVLFMILWFGFVAEEAPLSFWWWTYVVLAAANGLLALGDFFVLYRSEKGAS